MKNKIIHSMLAVAGIMLLTSCSKSYTTPDSQAASQNLTTELSSGTWIVSSFTQHTEDKTSKFSGSVFTFSANGSLTVVNNGKTITGTWQYSPAVTYYGSSSKSAISISLGNENPFDLLTKKWNLISDSDNTIKVDSPELAEDEHLQFSRQ